MSIKNSSSDASTYDLFYARNHLEACKRMNDPDDWLRVMKKAMNGLRYLDDFYGLCSTSVTDRQIKYAVEIEAGLLTVVRETAKRRIRCLTQDTSQ